MMDDGRSAYLDMLIARWVKLTKEYRKIEEQRRELAEMILGEPDMIDGTHRGGVVVVHARRFNAARAKEVLSPEDFDRICEWVPSAKRAEKELDPEVLELVKVQRRSRFLMLGTEPE